MNDCPHRQNASLIALQHGFPDRQTRGICRACGEVIHPREWRLGVPTADHPQGAPYLVDAHPDYGLIMALEDLSA